MVGSISLMNNWHRAKGIVSVLALLALLPFPGDSLNAGGRRPMQEPEKSLPTIRIMLGDDLQTIQRQSTYRFPRTNLGRIDIIAADKPFIFDYTRAPCDFSLPPGRSFGAAMNDLHAVSIMVSPQLRYISLDEAMGLIHDLDRLLQAKQWKISKRYAATKQIQDRFRNPQVDTDLTMRFEDLTCGDDKIYLEIARHWRKGESLTQLTGRDSDLFVVTVKIENDRVQEQYRGW